MEDDPKTEFFDSINPSNGKSGYTILVPFQNIDLSKTLLPPAIRAAKWENGKIILLNIIEIPYQLPPSEAEQFKLEREFSLQHARQVIETAGCDGEIIIRIAHRLSYAIEQLASSLGVDLIIMWAKNKGLLWNKEIYQKLYGVNCELLVAKEKGETHYEEIIIYVDDVHTLSTMIKHGIYLLGSEEGNLCLFVNYNTNDEERSLKKVRSIVNSFHRKNSWFIGKITINQLQSKLAKREYLNKISHNSSGSTCLLVSFSSVRNSRTENWFRKVAKEINIPIFISKADQVVPKRIDEITKKLKNWVKIIS